jgi:hypothetical protein
MNDDFRRFVEQLHPKYEALIAREPVKFNGLRPRDVPKSGVYVFSEGDSHLYAGRSKNMHGRLRMHCYGTPDQSALAFKLAREATGKIKATYTPAGSRTELMADPRFARAFQEAQTRIREMNVRFVEEADPTAQALLEIYVSIALSTRYNDFETH